MKPRAPRPSRFPFVPRPLFLALLVAGAIPVALATFFEPFVYLAAAIWLAALVALVADARATRRLTREDIARGFGAQLSLGAASPIRIAIRNPLARRLRLTLRDEAPAAFDVDRRAVAIEVPPRGEAVAEYTSRPRHRGSFQFGDIHARQRGPLGLVERQSRIEAAAEVKVYPDLREIRRYEITLRRGLAYDAGQRRARVPGSGSLFSRLRDYEPDDDPRSISWPATARRGRPIAVEYETERQQRLLLLIDAGRMMSSTLGTLTKLDHAVNTALMLAPLPPPGRLVSRSDSRTTSAATSRRAVAVGSFCGSPKSSAASARRRPSRTIARPSSSFARAPRAARSSSSSPTSSTRKPRAAS